MGDFAVCVHKQECHDQFSLSASALWKYTNFEIHVSVKQV